MTDEKKVVVEAHDFPDDQLGPAHFGFIRDGLKHRLAQKFTNAVFLFLAASVTIATFLSSSKREVELENKSGFVSLPDSPNEQSIAAPPIYDEIKEKNQISSAKDSKISQKPVEPLSVINLSRITNIPTGTESKAFLVSGASNGPVKAKLKESIKLDGDVLVDSGSILYGVGQSTEERLFISFTKLIRPNGSELKIKAQAFDMSDKIVGLKGSKVSDHAMKIALSAGLNFVSGYVEAMKEPEPIFGLTGGKKSPKDAAMNGAATAAADQSKSIMESIKNTPVIIEVKENSPIWIVFEEGDLN